MSKIVRSKVFDCKKVTLTVNADTDVVVSSPTIHFIQWYLMVSDCDVDIYFGSEKDLDVNGVLDVAKAGVLKPAEAPPGIPEVCDKLYFRAASAPSAATFRLVYGY